ncbi:hypothetical protein, partial [Cronobacter sakazakii]
FFWPSVLAVVAIRSMGCFYNLNEKMYVRSVDGLENRKAAVSPGA